MAKKIKKKAAKKKTTKSNRVSDKKTLPGKMKVYTTISPYLNFSGNCEEAFNFYKSVFGGEFSYIGRFKDMPPMEDKMISASDGEKIMHISLPISKETMLMGDDGQGVFGQAATAGNNFSISVNTATQQEADRLFNELSAGGRITMPINKTFWGSYFGQLTDKFGIQWMVSCELSTKKNK